MIRRRFGICTTLRTGNGIVDSKSIAVTSGKNFATILIDNGIKFVIHASYGYVVIVIKIQKNDIKDWSKISQRGKISYGKGCIGNNWRIEDKLWR